MNKNAKTIASEILENYIECFTNRDLTRLKDLYVEAGEFCYFDNHAGCDSDNIDDHFEKVKAFFESDESILGLNYEILSGHINGNNICAAAYVYYVSKPDDPKVRVTLVAELYESIWRIRHLHFSKLPTTA